jgi:hypothetical protein
MLIVSCGFEAGTQGIDNRLFEDQDERMRSWSGPLSN